jgi:hypothetical protein
MRLVLDIVPNEESAKTCYITGVQDTATNEPDSLRFVGRRTIIELGALSFCVTRDERSLLPRYLLSRSFLNVRNAQCLPSPRAFR